MSATAYKQLLASGIFQVIIGASCMLFGVVERVTTWYGTITSIPCLAIWMGLWICVTGILGMIAKGQMRGSSKALVGVYMGFSIVSVVFAGVMIICYSISLAVYYSRYNYYYRRNRRNAAFVVSILILIASLIEFGIGIWSSVCCCVIGPCCGQQPQMAPAGQAMYLQPQGTAQGTAPVSYVIVQGPDGTPVAVPAQSGGPMMVREGTPSAYSQGGGAVGTSVSPPHYQTSVQQPPPQDQVKVAF